MKIRDIMTPTVYYARPGETLRDLWKVIFAKHINAIPVVDPQKRLLGIVTKEDLLKSLYPDYQEYFEDITLISDFEEMENKVRALGDLKAKDIMRKRVIFTREDTPIMRALSRMIVHRVNQLPVLSDKNSVAGMVTKGDVFYALIQKDMKRVAGAGRVTTKKKRPQE